MSRKINLSAPLSDEDREYLEARGRSGDIRKNDRAFGGSVVAPTATSQERREEGAGSTEQLDWDAEVDDMTVDELKAELGSREPPLSTEGKKADLAARLKAAGPPEDEDES